jgi:hypothetical protein
MTASPPSVGSVLLRLESSAVSPLAGIRSVSDSGAGLVVAGCQLFCYELWDMRSSILYSINGMAANLL